MKFSSSEFKLPAVMGILNVTLDSFSDGGHFVDPVAAADWAQKMMADGAAIIDVGGESTRPGADPVSVDEELRRVVPVIERLTSLAIPVSIDTSKTRVAEAALKQGACFVNDVQAGADDGMLELCAEREVPICLMHMQGTPKTMQVSPAYGDVVDDVSKWLLARATKAREIGIAADSIWLDPGFGFGKTTNHNLELVMRVRELVKLGHPVLIGVSRKGFLGKISGSETTPVPTECRVEAGLVVQALCQQQGVKMIRTHDVAATVRQVKATEALMHYGSF